MKQKTTIDAGEASSARLLMPQSPLLTDDKGKAPLIDRSTAAANYPRDLCIHQLFEAQVEKTPDATAVVFESTRLTYRELNVRANHLAHRLIALGARPEILVGICVERSPEMLIALLATLKAGGAYLPLDPNYPEERLAFMLEDGAVPVLLTQRGVPLPRQRAKVVYIDGLDGDFDGYPDTDPESNVEANNLAYVIYTSGSTGRPKGVAIEHRSAVALLSWAADTFAPEQWAGTLASTSICFDLSVFELFVPLSVGGAVILVKNALELPNIACADQVTLVNTVPSAAVELLRIDGIPASVRTVNLAGEPLSTELVRQLYERGIDRVYDLYGPTEDTTYSTFALRSSHGRATIGRPIANTQVYILDPHLNPVPIGVPGELHLGGAGLARGYLNRPELTAEQFIANPFSDTPNARLYKTGDLARYLPDGNIEFLGRTDHQVKIRGFRIELGEIEAVLAQHPEVKACAVLVREDTPGDQRLIAYVVAKAEAPSLTELRGFIQSKLPEYMMPSAFVMLDALPMTPNGKLDRKALPAPSDARPDIGDAFVAPTNSLESMLADIYSDVLNIKQIGIHDNFLNLGGHSLLAAQIIARVREALQIELPVRLLLEGSSVSELAARIETSEPKKYVPLTLIARQGDLPVSFSQERAWFIQQLDTSSIAYSFQATLRFTGKLDSAALERSLSEIVRRHEILRTSFPEVSGRPIQLVHTAELVRLPLVDLQTVSGSEREAAAQRIIGLEIRKRLDLAKLPLVRWLLIRLAADEHILLQIEHHLIHDGWSFHVLLGELLELYKAFTAGKPSPLAEPEIQFADFAIAQRRWMEGEEAVAQLDYWKTKLNGAAALAWRSDRPRPPQQTFVGVAPRIELPFELCESLRALSRRAGVTLFMTMFAGFLIVLQRYTAQNDICVGSGIANRRWRETEGLIGMMLNNIVLRNDLSGDPDSHQLLRRVQQTTLDAYANQDVPFDQVVRVLEQARDASRNPLFQVMFSFHDSPLRNLGFPKLKTSLLCPLSNGSAKFDLNVIVIPRAEQRAGRTSEGLDAGITLVWEYNSDLFDDATMRRMIGHYQNVLQGIVADQTMRISELPLISPSERNELIEDWNANSTAYPDHHAVAELFEEQVARNPDAVALIFEGAQLSYRELNEQANRLAHHLIARGVGPEVLVALCLNRSSELIVALLAILKAGGAYLALDPDYPKERLSFMLEDGRVSIVITTSALSPTLPALSAERVLLYQPESFQIYPSANPLQRAGTDNLAYVIYTSGSTGTPKGVTIPHRGVVRLVKNTNYADFNSTDIFLQFAPVSFDASTFEIWGALLNGARLVIMPSHRAALEDLADTLMRERVTTLWLTASLFHLMVDQHLDALRQLRQLLAGGDVLSVAHVEKFLAATPACRLINGYGPTENTTFTGCYSIPQDAKFAWSVPIGRPVANTQVYILDPHLNPVPMGIPGELHIGGAGLARGYLNRPELTAEKFIANPFSGDPYARLYKTGDLVRYLPDGNIEFLGRLDTQVKIRGFRIEPGEIEAVLNQHPYVKACAVLARDDTPGDKRLVAYTVPDENASAASADLRGFLRRKLPDYMLPAVFIVLDALPLTANGKLDRKALPAPDDTRPEVAAYVAPRTPNEEVLVAIWAEVLKLDKIGIHDNFFALGGHSLLATQVISRMRAAFHIDLPLRALFEGPTIRELTASMASHTNSGNDAIPRLPRTGDAQVFPLSLAQQRLWFIQQLEPGSGIYNITKALRLRGALDVSALTQSLNEIVRRHESLRTAFFDDGKEQVVQQTVTLGVPLSDFSELSLDEREASVRRLAIDDERQPFDLSRAPLLRAQLARLDDDEHVLFLSMHHIVSDGTSLGLLHRELSELYRVYRSEETARLPELPIQYADFALWQLRYLDGDAMNKQLAYWKKQLGGKLPVLELPLDRPRPATQQYDGGKCVTLMPEKLVEEVKELSRRESATLFTTFLAAFQLLLYRVSGQEDILIGTPIAGRNRIETEALIGFFIGTLVIRGDLSGNPSFKDLLRRTRKTTLDAYEHQDVPFEKLVEELQPERNLARNPIFDIFVNYFTGKESELLRLDDVTVEPLMPEDRLSKFSMTLYIRSDGPRFELDLTFQTALFSPQRIACMLEQYCYLLEQICTAPDRSITDYSLITPASKALLPDPSLPIAEPDYGLTVDEIAAWARRAPDKIALSQNGRVLSYDELWKSVEAIARTLWDRGLRQKDVVAISGPKSFGLIACVAAVLLSGGVMLTLDRRFPVERQRLLLRETYAKHILYVGDFRAEDEWMRELDAVTIVDVKPESAMPTSSIAANRTKGDLPKVTPNDPAYIFFTSGTTGVPKGILGNHKGLSHFLAWQRETFAIRPDDRIAQLTALSFDVVLREVFLPLTSGASLHLPDEMEGLAAGDVVPWLARERISVLHTVPALAQSWLADAPRDLALPDLRWVFFAGEPLQDALAKRWRDAFSFTGAIVNLYGPTETTLAKCFHRVEDVEPLGAQPVGRPLPQTQALVLNASGALCGIGEAGEIAIRTPFRTLGYINAPDENRERFIKSPFTDDKNDMLYLTGDRGRYRPDGTLMVEGRLDDQVKINGVRVEPNEAAAMLAKHPAVQACFVRASKAKEGVNLLAAYVVLEKDQSANASDLRGFLSANAPAPLIPSAFVFLDRLPLLPNGKVDRKALPAPVHTPSAVPFVAARTPTEQTLVNIYAEVLKRERVGIHDNFFELGGHSLLATRVISRVRQALHCELPLHALFAAPTIERLAVTVTDIQMQSEDANEMARFLADLENSSNATYESDSAIADVSSLALQRSNVTASGKIKDE